MSKRIGTALIMVLLSGATVLAQDGARRHAPSANSEQQGAPDEQSACTNDAVKYCGDAIPDTFRVLACLQQNRRHISGACRAVLKAHGQ